MIDDGNYSLSVVDAGGSPRLMDLPNPLALSITWVRDDTGTLSATIPVPKDNSFSEIRSVRHEIVVHRNGARVWEGPITLVGFGTETLQIEASDISWFLHRRALEYEIDVRSHPVFVPGLMKTMLLAHFPVGDMRNIGKFLTVYETNEDPRTAAQHTAYSKTVFDVLDQYAWTGGIDYTVQGRRIVINDTHLRLSVLPKFSDADFKQALTVTEYGNQLKTRSISSNNGNSYGIAVADPKWLEYYGKIDVVGNSVEEGGDDDTQEETDQVLEERAQRTLYDGAPAPIQINIPDNIGLVKTAPVQFADLVPGAWIPVESLATPRKMQQWQRIDKVTVTATADQGESISLVLSQAPSTFRDWGAG